MNKRAVYSIYMLCLTLIAVMLMSRAVDAQATVTFTSATVAIEQGVSSVDFFGQINNTSGSAISPSIIDISFTTNGTAPPITAYDSFNADNTNNLPATVAAGAVYPTMSSIEFFTIDTSNLNPGFYSGNLVLTDGSNALTAPAGFSITVTPEPSAAAILALGAMAVGVLIIRARRRTSL